jgi:hypothetical protein
MNCNKASERIYPNLICKKALLKYSIHVNIMSKIIPLIFFVLLGQLFMTGGYAFAYQKIDTLIKHQFTIDAGIHRNYYINKEESKYKDGFPTPQSRGYSAYKYFPENSGHAGIWYNLFFNPNLILKTGVIYFNRIIKKEGNSDTIRLYQRVNQFSGFHVLNAVYSYHNIEIPIMFGCKYKKIQIFAGLLTRYYVITRVTEEDINGIKHTSKKRFKIDYTRYYNYDITARLNYSFRIKDKTPSIYIAANRLSKNYYEFLLGIEFPIINIIKK